MTFLAAAIQMAAGADKAANLGRAERLVRIAAERGAALVALPEMFNWRGARADENANAEPLEGESLARMAALARELKIHLIAGSITECGPAGANPVPAEAENREPQFRAAGRNGANRNYNTSALFGPGGERIAVYRKIHLFDVDLPGRVTVRESAVKIPGGEIVCASTSLGAIGLSVCYDLRFPELYRRLTFAGARIIAIPSAFTFPTGEAHWETLVRARAIENQVYAIAPAQFGPNVHGYSDYGNSMIADPWGRVIARAADREDIAIATIDPEYQDRVRRELPALEHARLIKERKP